MAEGKPTGHIRAPRDRPGRLYAEIRRPDGTRVQRALAKLWTKHSRPPDGYLTRAKAEARLQAMLEGKDRR